MSTSVTSWLFRCDVTEVVITKVIGQEAHALSKQGIQIVDEAVTDFSLPSMLSRRRVSLLSFALLRAVSTRAEYVDQAALNACPGYNAVNVSTSANGRSITADLVLAGEPCNIFGNDIETLRLDVSYETDTRIHVKITDPVDARYEVPESVFPRPTASNSSSPSTAQIQFGYTTEPFTFSISRLDTNETLFATSAEHPLIFEPQYLRIKSMASPPDANIYGLGEHTEPFRLPTNNLTRTFWSRDAYGIPHGTNLYGNHPVYIEHRQSGTHGAFLLNSNGMDIKINQTDGATSIEYNVIGGILDFYFLAGPGPIEVSKQYAEVVGTPAEVPYWGFGLHQCRFGYLDFVDVAGVITNYSEAGIPLETMWTDIDYMDRRRIFTLDPEYFPLSRMREIVDFLHDNGQRYIVMTDPAVAYFPDESYAPLDRGTELDLWLKWPNGSYIIGVVWPGPTVFPDWFNPRTQEYWNNEFEIFYSPEDGLDIDGAWIDMNEPANFCNLPCTDPFQQAIDGDFPPARTTPPPDINTPIFVNATRRNKSQRSVTKPRQVTRDILNPPYAIDNAAPDGDLSAKTVAVNATHFNNLTEYDVHNLYGHMMSTATHGAMLNRRPGLRTLIITRSTFAGAGRQVGKWLGDNLSNWEQYRFSIAGMLGFTSIYQIPMVGSDICGFGLNTTETLCARWAMLGGFYPFMRNHNQDTSISQEFYRWPMVAEAAKNVLDMRYRLMDYIYTAFHQASLDGTPVLQPLFYQFPNDPNTFPIDLQFLYGDSILVSPVTEENSTTVSIYLPSEGTFYDFLSFAPVPDEQKGNVTLTDVDFTQIPVHILGGAILPLRVEGAMTTDELREKDFEIVVAQSKDGVATGKLYVDDGVSIEQPGGQTFLDMSFANGTLSVSGEFGFALNVNLKRVVVLGVDQAPTSVEMNGTKEFEYDEERNVVTVELDIPFTDGFEMNLV
ncbi:alpha-glucosidase [Moniliophthora roreri MCA 2997]|uniref:beta-glucosidase n=1 Tax=Moniliophthora roreri (strain MCA 2997) TaxID=1381753 RepID=V2X8N3_MONRO|nr:alpha-glucosidase [Moniliophthora roreri MCA 2997]